jgi:hypothetical protein
MAIFQDIFKRKKKKPDDSIDFAKLKEVVDNIFNESSNRTAREEMTRFLNRYKGKWWEEGNLRPTDSRIAANLFFSTVMTIAPLITDNRPIWSIRARKPYLQNQVEAFSLALEYLWDKLEMDMRVFKWILDALIMKIGIGKVYFDPDSDDVAFDVIDPRTFFCAPGYDDIWDSPLCGMKVSKPISWIRTKYPETGKDVKPDEKDDKVPDDAQNWQLENKYANVYEVWLKDDEAETYFIKEDAQGNTEEVDKKTEGATEKTRQLYPFGRIVVFTKDSLLDDKPSPYRHGKPPYVALYDIIVPHELIGMGEGNQIEELNKSYNRNLQLVDNWTRYKCDSPVLVDTNAGMDIEQLKKEIPAGGGIFAFNGMASQKPAMQMEIGNLDTVVFTYMSGLSKLVEEISGVTDITKGMTSKSQRQSATEISTLIESAYTRTRQRVRNFEFSTKRILYLMLDTMQQFYTEPRNFSRTVDNQNMWYTVGNSKAQAQTTMGQPGQGKDEEEDRQLTEDAVKFMEEFGDVDEIYADYDLEIQTNSTLPMDKQSLANLFLRLLEMAGGNPVTGMPMWEAALSALRIPKYKEIIAKMQELFDKQNQPQGQPGIPGLPGAPPEAGPPGIMQMMEAAGMPPQGAPNE